MQPFIPIARRIMRHGHFTVIDAHGRPHVFDGEKVPGLSPVTIRLHDPALHWKLALRPAAVIGEAYMDGTLTVEEGTLYDFLALGCYNIHRYEEGFSPVAWLDRVTSKLHQWNPVAKSRRNVAHHYDLSAALYSLFLDNDRQYSCAYFPEPGMNIEDAQTAKRRHIIAKLMLEPGQSVLDIGCGWGGLALSMAREMDVEVTGITLSEEQLKVARQRAEEEQLSHRVRFLLCDYRQMSGRFDRIVSVGMFEHVGTNHYQVFFDRLRDLLTDRGVALLHSIGRAHGPGSTNAWVRKYIFPGGYTPALSEVLPSVEKTRLFVTDIELLYLHYAETLRKWSERFARRRAEAAELYDERFCRMWEFYLAGSEAAFREQDQMVFQMQLTRELGVAPMSRDYIHAAEQGFMRV